MINEEVAQKLIKTAYDQIRVVKLIQRGHRSATVIAKKMKWKHRQKADYYLKQLTKE